MQFSGRHSWVWVACAAFVAACRSYDPALVEHPSRAHGTSIGDAGAADGGEFGMMPIGNPTSPGEMPAQAPGCMLNPAFGGALTGCPVICPETCNGLDDDCDGNVDEDLENTCELDHAVAACSRGRCLIVECEPGFRDCDHDPTTGCEVTDDDPNNCGSCGNRCVFPHAIAGCKDNACVPLGCEPLYADCDQNPSDCETSANTLDNCSGCGKRCSDADVKNAVASCETGSCGVGQCFSGYGDCDGNATNGCEQALNTTDNCGGCNQSCNFAGSVSDCGMGVCLSRECQSGYDDCDGNSANGCESLDTNQRCGACSKACDAARLTNVVSGQCDNQVCKLECATGFADCDGDSSNGCETSVTTLQRCGACDTPCARPNAVMSCDTGSCELVRCEPNFADCNNDLDSDGCETNLITDTHCGACGTDCTGSGKPVCSGGSCSNVTCPDPNTADCDQNGLPCEVNLKTDVNHCGSCSNACAFTTGTPHASAGLSCQSGRCTPTCDANFADCNNDYRDGCETPLTTSTNCGQCGQGCAIANATATCASGSCKVQKCADDWADCDNDQKSCETQLGTTQNCMGCGMSCALANAVSSCTGTVDNHSCAIASCKQFFLDCDGTASNGCEIDVRSNAKNCGQCKNDCTKDPHVASASCSNGVCGYSCASNFGNCNGMPGCETPLTTDSDCHGCGVSCARANGSADCSTGTCALTGCDTGFKDCDANPDDGCEPLTSLTDCGDCGVPCQIANGTGSCDTLSCAVQSCNTGWADCDGDPSNGCERETDPPGSGGSGPCLPDASCMHAVNNGQDYYFCPMTRSLDDARTHCQTQLLGDLVEINDAAENSFVHAHISQDSWIGATDRAVEGTFRWLNDNSIFYTNGAATTYANWNSGEPNDSGGNEDCVEMYTTTGLWNDSSCSNTLGFVCEVQKDLCPNDPSKINPGQCGCGMPDTDTDNDGTADCNDGCPNDANKTAPGACGCGTADTDSDGDGTPNCHDMCPNDANKTAPGACGCGTADTDSDGDGTADCNDACAADPTRVATPCGLDFTPTNFSDSVNYGLGPSATLNCGTTTIDTTGSITITNWCGSAPMPVVQTPASGPELAVLPLQSLTIASGATLRVVGSRPLVLAVRGNVSISGTIDARGSGATPGAGGNVSCSGGNGSNGASDSSSNEGAGGGGGAGFANSNAGNGGTGDQQFGSTGGGNHGTSEADTSLSPLRGGCRGGRGGNGSGTGGAGGGGGGAVQISAAGTLTVTSSGVISVSGGGGQNSSSRRDGGGGGGSGGAVFLEAHVVTVSSGAWITANGGGGASGHPNTSSGSAPGADGSLNNNSRAAGGNGNDSAGNGGSGAAGSQSAGGGGNGDCFGGLGCLLGGTFGAGGGGGGGGVGRIRVHGTQSCSLNSGSFSPASGATNCP